MNPVEVSVLLVSYNSVGLLPRLAASIDACTDVNMQVLVLDNASVDGSAEWFARCRPDWQLVVNRTNVGFGRANNQLLPLVRGRHLLLLNTDAFMAPDALRAALDYLTAHPDVGIVGAQLRGDDGLVQPSARFFPAPWRLFLQRSGLDRWLPMQARIDLPFWQIAEITDCDWVPGCFYLIRREALDHVGLFDPRFFLYYEEIDHARRTKRAGYKVRCLPHVDVIHVGGASSQSVGEVTASGRQLQALLNESEVLYLRKHFGIAGLCLHLLLQSTLSSAQWLVWRLRSRPGRAPAAAWAVLTGLWRSVLTTRGGQLPTR